MGGPRPTTSTPEFDKNEAYMHSQQENSLWARGGDFKLKIKMNNENTLFRANTFQRFEEKHIQKKRNIKSGEAPLTPRPTEPPVAVVWEGAPSRRGTVSPARAEAPPLDSIAGRAYGEKNSPRERATAYSKKI